MKLLVNLPITLVLTLGFLPVATALAQVTNMAIPSTEAQAKWNSHQINQPPPIEQKFNLSPDRLEEIRQLYLEAKKELERKTPTSAPLTE